MKKKIWLMILGMFLLMAAVHKSQPAYAYLTDRRTTETRLSMGSVQVQLQYEEPNQDSHSSKGPSIVNIGENDCFVRVEIVLSDSSMRNAVELVGISKELVLEDEKPLTNTDISFDQSQQPNTLTFYYRDKLGPQKATAPLFQDVRVKGDGLTADFEIGISVAAVQTTYDGKEIDSPVQAFQLFEQ